MILKELKMQLNEYDTSAAANKAFKKKTHRSFDSAIESAIDFIRSSGYEPDGNEFLRNMNKPESNSNTRFLTFTLAKPGEKKRTLALKVVEKNKKFEAEMYYEGKKITDELHFKILMES